MANLAGVWLGLVAGFGGMRDHAGELTFAPRLPPGWRRLRFGMTWHSQQLRVTITREEASYDVLDGDRPMRLRHHGEEFTVDVGKQLTLKIPPVVTPAPVHQPAGRPPLSRKQLGELSGPLG
jgi:alpha,alpha-trehalose phosphorylase